VVRESPLYLINHKNLNYSWNLLFTLKYVCVEGENFDWWYDTNDAVTLCLLFFILLCEMQHEIKKQTHKLKKKRISSPSIKISTFDNFHILILKIKYIFGLLTYTGN